jgi:hypothetical protein
MAGWMTPGSSTSTYVDTTPEALRKADADPDRLVSKPLLIETLMDWLARWTELSTSSDRHIQLMKFALVQNARDFLWPRSASRTPIAYTVINN